MVIWRGERPLSESARAGRDSLGTQRWEGKIHPTERGANGRADGPQMVRPMGYVRPRVRAFHRTLNSDIVTHFKMAMDFSDVRPHRGALSRRAPQRGHWEGMVGPQIVQFFRTHRLFPAARFSRIA
jgi:hypothetical protein